MVTGCSGRGTATAAGAARRRRGRLGRDPADIRAALLDRWGTARVVAADGSVPQVPALRAFRSAGASIPEACTSAALLAAEGVAGMYVEMELFAQRLRAQVLQSRFSGMWPHGSSA